MSKLNIYNYYVLACTLLHFCVMHYEVTLSFFDKMSSKKRKVTAVSNSLQPLDGSKIPGIQGKQYAQGDNEYDTYNYQYATSSHGVENNMKPKLIVHPENKNDIQTVVKYAKEKNISVAVRTGGHQYSGASSTFDPNILLDLKNTFTGIDDLRIIGDNKVYTSVCWDLLTFNMFLGKHKLFVPHGQCCNVHLGGHVQTGGYGQLGRSFGLMGDSVISLDIIDSDGEIDQVSKDNNPDLFYAILGGSPGNFCVITHFTIGVYSDKDYEGSCGLKSAHLYTRKKLKALLNILAEMSADDDLPRNYDYCVSMLSSKSKFFDYFDQPEKEELDKYMKKYHPDLFGDDEIPLGYWPPIIIVYAQWIKINKDDTPDMNWFYRIKNAGGLGFNVGVMRKPVSELTTEWIFRDIREFNTPYNKRTYVTNSKDLNTNGWTDWVTRRIDEIVSGNNGCRLAVQVQNYNGKHSKFFQNKDNGTSYSWRDSTVVCVLDCFYNNNEKSKKIAYEWQRKNDVEAIGENGKFSKQDKRVLWGSYGKFNMNDSWPYYHDNIKKYERLCKIREKVDPKDVFASNAFCVGYKVKHPTSASLVNTRAERLYPKAVSAAYQEDIDDEKMSYTQRKERESREGDFLIKCT